MDEIQNAVAVVGVLAIIAFATILIAVESREAIAISQSNCHYGDMPEFYSIQTNNLGEVRLTYPTVGANMFGAGKLKPKIIPCQNIHRAKELKDKMIARAKHKKAKKANEEWKPYNGPNAL